tara:strand:+ start:1034 stop:1894 length:861 start_codon:yes stop_codon:yes gene_type:complete
MLSLDQFRDRIVTPERLEKLFEINPNRKEYIEKMSPDFDYRYIVIEDALMNPYDVRDFLINGAYMAGTNDLNPTKTGAPGMQQPVANEWAKPYIQYLRNLLFHKKITTKDITWHDFHCYNNVFWKGMKSIDSNYRPHVDPGDFAFNLYLTDDMVDDGTAMYSLNVGSKKFMDVREMQENAELRSSTIASIMDIDRVGVGQLDDWKCFKGDDVYNLECVVPGAFNHISGYRGSLFHSAYYDDQKYPDGHVRFSLVAMLSVTNPPAGKSSFITKKSEDPEYQDGKKQS